MKGSEQMTNGMKGTNAAGGEEFFDNLDENAQTSASKVNLEAIFRP